MLSRIRKALIHIGRNPQRLRARPPPKRPSENPEQVRLMAKDRFADAFEVVEIDPPTARWQIVVTPLDRSFFLVWVGW